MKARAMLILISMVGCGQGAEPPPGGGAPEKTLSIANGALSETSVSLPAGSTLIIVNDDAVAHQMASGPHPQHSGCPELNGPVLQPGERFTAVLSAEAKTCGLHDHLNPSAAALKATVTTVVGAQKPPVY